MLYNVKKLVEMNKEFDKKDFVFFWSHRPTKTGEISKTCLSQWFICDFEEDGIIFSSAEKYMMYKKALLFNDNEIAKKILKIKTPRKIKELGREIKGFDRDIWEAEKEAIVLKGNILKFSQNVDLKAYLLSTGSRILAEASPADTIWGIGLTKHAEVAIRPDAWLGTNLLGFVLMEARDTIKEL